MRKANTIKAMATPPTAMPTICPVLSTGLDATLSGVLLFKGVIWGVGDVVGEVSNEEGELTLEESVEEAGEFVVAGGEAMTIMLTCSVEVGALIEGGRVSIVEDDVEKAAVVEVPRRVAVIVRAVFGCAPEIPAHTLYTPISS